MVLARFGPDLIQYDPENETWYGEDVDVLNALLPEALDSVPGSSPHPLRTLMDWYEGTFEQLVVDDSTVGPPPQVPEGDGIVY